MNSTSDASPSSGLPTPDLPPEKGHPAGLWVLFITEMWERFSYYGMRALLVLYLIASTQGVLENGETNTNPGFGWSESSAYLLYGVYTWAVYLTPIFGGWLADKFLGTHRSMLVGGWIIAAGHITLAMTELFGVTPGQVVTLQTGPGAVICFGTGLALIVIGTGFFKPCVSVMVGQLYRRDDPRRDSGFTIFYMGINLGAFLSPLVAGYLGEMVGWHWGFGSAAVGMLAGLFTYQVLRPRYLRGIGDPPAQKGSAETLMIGAAAVAGLAVLAVVLGLFVLPLMSSWGLEQVFWGAIAFLGLVAIVAFLWMQPRQERAPLAVIFILALVGNIFFWTAFEQAGSSLNVFAKQKTDRTLGGLLDGENFTLVGAIDEEGFPASWYQSVNPLAILVFASLFAVLWVWLERRNLNPSTPMKFAWGLYLLGMAFIPMMYASWATQDGELAGAHWLLLTYVGCTWGELCLSPVGLSMVTKLAPDRLQSLMMGFWFFTFSLANLCAGLVALLSTKVESGEITFVFEGLAGFFFMLVVASIAAGVAITVLTPLLKKMMQGVK